LSLQLVEKSLRERENSERRVEESRQAKRSDWK
jgi:hypothetical protein